MSQLDLRPMIVTVSGIRALAPESIRTVETAISGVLSAAEVRFGGALGSDTVALRAASALRQSGTPRLVVVVPFDQASQPAQARSSFELADEVRELRLPRTKASYLRRNDFMLQGATLLLAFWDAREEGGTYYTIRKARGMGIPTQLVEVSRCIRPGF